MRIPLTYDRCLVLELRARCRHDVLGICPRCYPAESRTLRNRKLAIAIAWLQRIRATDPFIKDPAAARGMAEHALSQIGDLT
jgi:hypothetical protein